MQSVGLMGVGGGGCWSQRYRVGLGCLGALSPLCAWQEAEAKAVLEDRAQQLAESAAAAAVLLQQLERCALGGLTRT